MSSLLAWPSYLHEFIFDRIDREWPHVLIRFPFVYIEKHRRHIKYLFWNSVEDVGFSFTYTIPKEIAPSNETKMAAIIGEKQKTIRSISVLVILFPLVRYTKRIYSRDRRYPRIQQRRREREENRLFLKARWVIQLVASNLLLLCHCSRMPVSRSVSFYTLSLNDTTRHLYLYHYYITNKLKEFMIHAFALGPKSTIGHATRRVTLVRLCLLLLLLVFFFFVSRYYPAFGIFIYFFLTMIRSNWYGIRSGIGTFKKLSLFFLSFPRWTSSRHRNRFDRAAKLRRLNGSV